MIGRTSRLWLAGGIVALAGALSGCNSSNVPVAETPPPTVSVSQPVVRDVVDQDDYEGHIEAVETVEVRARVRGYLVKVGFQDGQVVQKGDPLFEIDPAPYQATLDGAEAQKAAAEAALDYAKKEYARVNKLTTQNAASREERDVWVGKQAVASADRLRAMAAVEEARLDLNYCKINAPIAGKTSRAQLTVGNLINAKGGETLMTTITSVDPMYVYFDVDERALLRYRQTHHKDRDKSGVEPPIKDLKIPVYVGLEGETGFPHQGVLDFADNRVNPGTGTILVRGVLKNPTRILDAGMRARVRVPVSDPHRSLMITERAVGTDQSRKFVYVVTKDNVAERRDVKLDRVVDGLQVIADGLAPEDWVVVNGIQRVRDQEKVEPKKVPMPGTPTAAAGEVGTIPPTSPPAGKAGAEGAAQTKSGTKS